MRTCTLSILIRCNSTQGIGRINDTSEVAENVGPFLGHHGYHTPGTYMDYEPWPLMDYFKVVSEVFQTPRRYDAARTFHNNLRTHIRSQLPSETPTVAMLGGGADPKAGTFYPVAIENGGGGRSPTVMSPRTPSVTSVPRQQALTMRFSSRQTLT